jgi:hypothetical protein
MDQKILQQLEKLQRTVTIIASNMVTKDDAKKFVTKEDLKLALASYPTKDDLRQELAKYATKEDLRQLKTDLKTDLRQLITLVSKTRG